MRSLSTNQFDFAFAKTDIGSGETLLQVGSEQGFASQWRDCFVHRSEACRFEHHVR